MNSQQPQNRLAQESSLYLRQHASNPVDWYPWGEEAITRAKQLDRPIFLSIGYSACHWCHVMEHESFEDETTAAYLNEHFVSIKVDREERPDLDSIYMSAHQLLSREGGGWPLSVWLTPDMHPFYAGTYFPPDNRYAPQRPSFRTVLSAIVDAWKTRREEISEKSQNLSSYLQSSNRSESSGDELSVALLERSKKALQRGFDPVHGGFGTQPKFPHPLELRMLLRVWKRADSKEALHMVTHTLDKMAMGGIYDQIGGGFHRYSVDNHWLVPHFEKMLYDNALLTSNYVEAYLVTKNPSYRETIEATLNYILREMTSEPGAFFSTQDADSEGEEGKFYVWSKSEIERHLTPEIAERFCYVYGVTEYGNFEGHTILNREKTWDQCARMLQIPLEQLRSEMHSAAATLYQVRSKRVWPGRDEKILTAWNGLMIAAFAQAGMALENPQYVQAASQAADFILHNLRNADGKLYRACGIGSPAKCNAYLEDYACFMDALIHLYEATFDVRWLRTALELTDTMMDQFADPEGGFYFTGLDHEKLIVRTKDTYDGSTPSGNSMAVTSLLRLAILCDRRDLYLHAEKTLKAFQGMMEDSPGGTGQMLAALDFYFGPVEEIVVVGKQEDEETKQVLRAFHQSFHPNRILVFHDPSTGPAPSDLIPLLRNRPMQDRVTTYICRNYTCEAPIVGAEGIMGKYTQISD